MANDLITTGEILDQGLRKADTENTRAVLKDADLYSFLISTFNGAIKLASGNPADIAVGLSSKTLATTKLVGKSSDSKNLVVGVTAAQIIMTTAGLVTVASKGPTSAVVAIGAAFAKKTSLALSLAGGDDKRAKCLAALTDLAASGLTAGLVLPSAATGIGAVVLAGSLAQLILSGYQVHKACIASD